MMTERALVEANNFDLPLPAETQRIVDDRIHGEIANPEEKKKHAKEIEIMRRHLGLK
jgi:hypothetical protein